MNPQIGDALYLLNQFAKSDWARLDVRQGAFFLSIHRHSGLAPATVAVDEVTGDVVEVKAPSLGTFRNSDFAIGSVVAADSPVGYLEILGERQPIPAGQAGFLLSVTARDGELVEYETPLATINSEAA